MSTHISVLSYKLFPPRSSASCESLLTAIDQLAPTNPDYVSVAYSGDRARKQKTLALLDHLVHETRLTPWPTSPVWGTPPRSWKLLFAVFWRSASAGF